MLKNKHHLFWPASDYQSGVAKVFRRLPCNTVEIGVKTHQLLHQYQPPPKKPSNDAMWAAINRHSNMTCGCYPEPETGRQVAGW